MVKPNFMLVNQLLPIGCFTPTELIFAFSSCPKLRQVSHGCGISQPLKFNRTQSLFYTPKRPRHREGGEAGKKRPHMKKRANDVCFKLRDVVFEGGGGRLQFQ